MLCAYACLFSINNTGCYVPFTCGSNIIVFKQTSLLEV